MPIIPIPILMYHSIEAMPKSTVMRSLHVSPKRFEIQMWLLNMLGYKGLSMRELAPYLEGQKTGKVVGITFDDGYFDKMYLQERDKKPDKSKAKAKPKRARDSKGHFIADDPETEINEAYEVKADD